MHLEDTVNTVLVIATFSLAKILHMSCIDFFSVFGCVGCCHLVNSMKLVTKYGQIW